MNLNFKKHNPNEYAYGIDITNQEINLKTIDGDIITISDTGIFKTTANGIVTKITTKGQLTFFEIHCPLCDSHHGCDNCYYGQVEARYHCEDCDTNLSEWRPLGDAYCRKCGRKLVAKT